MKEGLITVYSRIYGLLHLDWAIFAINVAYYVNNQILKWKQNNQSKDLQ